MLKKTIWIALFILGYFGLPASLIACQEHSPVNLHVEHSTTSHTSATSNCCSSSDGSCCSAQAEDDAHDCAPTDCLDSCHAVSPFLPAVAAVKWIIIDEPKGDIIPYYYPNYISTAMPIWAPPNIA